MTSPDYARAAVAQLDRMRARDSARDSTMSVIRAVRAGNMRALYPAELEFDLSFQGAPTANFIDTVARSVAEALAPLPSLACVSGRMQTVADQRRAERKNKIGLNYWAHARLATQMFPAADRYVSYGFVPLLVEPDAKAALPYLHVEDSRHAYYDRDRYGRVVRYGRVFTKSIDELCDLFPELTGQISTDPRTGQRVDGASELEMIRWADDADVSLFLPARGGLLLHSYSHKLTRCPVVVAERPSLDGRVRGQFDDVIWVQVARAVMATLALEAAYNAVQAPIAVPSDMDELPVGPNAIYQSDNANQIHRVNLELPSGIFAQEAVMQQEMSDGARFPAAMQGNVNASVITGKGVEALVGTFSAQITGAQLVMAEFLQDATSLAFEMDEKWWPQRSKTVNGTLSGSSYEFGYTPAADIDGRYDSTVTYGFAAGMNPAQSIVTMLQLEGAGLIAKGTTQQNLPFSIDPVQETRKIDVEGSREALKQGLFSLVQSSGAVATQGADPLPIIKLGVDVIHSLQQGKPVEDAVQAAYEALAAAQQQAQADAQAQQEQAAQVQQGPPAPPAQPGPPGTQPTVEDLIAGFRGNQAVNSAQLRRTVGTGVQ